MDDSGQYSYDLVPYESHSFPGSHPNNLATIATLFGMTPAPIDNCRVLELGCAGGGNVIPMACNLPESAFVGIDLSARQIEMGQGTVEALGLTNIKLLHRSIDDIASDFGVFDYIIAHEVYSWVPEPIREKIMSICKNNLSRNGVAYVSYNTYTGWHMPEALREMMLYHVSSFKEAKTQTDQARALLTFLRQATAEKTSAYGSFLKTEVDTLRRKKDAYIFHEFLETVNHPVYFHQFTEKAARHGLQYLGEASISSMLAENFPKAVVQKLRLARDIIRQEQYMDFVLNRRFRATLLCHAGQELVRKLKFENVVDFYISSAARPKSEDQDLSSSKKVTLVIPGVGTAAISWTEGVKTALMSLWRKWPSAVTFARLFAETKESLLSNEKRSISASDEPENALRRGLAANLLRLYFAGIVGFHVRTPKLAAGIGDLPKVAPLTRLQARQSNWVTNQWHRPVILEPFDRRLVQYLDGEHDRDALESEMTRLIEAGTLIDKESKEIGRSAQEVRESVAHSLERVAGSALLIE